MMMGDIWDTVVVGGGPAGATAAEDLAHAGRRVLMLDRAGRIKPCGGAIPPKAVRDFAIPESQIVARATSARIIAPSARSVDMPIEDGFVAMVDREHFDPYLRDRAVAAGATRRDGTFERLDYAEDGTVTLQYRPRGAAHDSPLESVRARSVIGADGALSQVGRQTVPGADRMPYVFAYHEIVRTPAGIDGARCHVHYDGTLSPDFYAWIFPHGETSSIGTGSMRKGFSLRGAVGDLRAQTGFGDTETLRREGAPIPLRPLPRWDDGRAVLLAGDAAGVVAPASGEGIFYAMLGGRLAADAVQEFLETGRASALRRARRKFMRTHGAVFWMLGIMQKYWYSNDNRRERFVAICRDKDVQDLTWDAYMNKELVKAKPLAHAKIFFKNIAHLTGIVAA